MTSRDEAVEQLLDSRGRALVGYAYLLCGNVHDAEDLVQDALVKTFARRRAGTELRSAEAYVRRAICTLYLDRWRSRKRWAGRLPVAWDRETTEGPEDAVTNRTDVVAALATLPPQQRAAVVLRYYEDLTVPEVAERMGLGDGTVKRYLSLATHRLGDLLGADRPTRPRRARPGGVMFDLTRAMTDAADAATEGREPAVPPAVHSRIRRRVDLRRTSDTVLGLAAAGAIAFAVMHLGSTTLPPVAPTETTPTPTSASGWTPAVTIPAIPACGDAMPAPSIPSGHAIHTAIDGLDPAVPAGTIPLAMANTWVDGLPGDGSVLWFGSSARPAVLLVHDGIVVSVSGGAAAGTHDTERPGGRWRQRSRLRLADPDEHARLRRFGPARPGRLRGLRRPDDHARRGEHAAQQCFRDAGARRRRADHGRGRPVAADHRGPERDPGGRTARVRRPGVRAHCRRTPGP